MHPNQAAKRVLDAAFDIHHRLGPGLLESVYCIVLAYELTKRGLHVEREVAVPVVWDGIQIEMGYRADLVVERCLLLELKSAEAIAAVHKKQVLTYLRLMDLQLGLLMNFGAAVLKDGVHRIVNGLETEPPAIADLEL